MYVHGALGGGYNAFTLRSRNMRIQQLRGVFCKIILCLFIDFCVPSLLLPPSRVLGSHRDISLIQHLLVILVKIYA